MEQRIWFRRPFALGEPTEAALEIIERLRGTPLRVRERTAGVASETLRLRRDGAWSIQEHVGHLIDLEELWDGRLDDFESHAETLRAADLENRATWEADHNVRSMELLVADFARLRERLVVRVEAMSDDALASTALHPRLDQPMTVVDLLFFVAEHDDHHLAAITRLRSRGR